MLQRLWLADLDPAKGTLVRIGIALPVLLGRARWRPVPHPRPRRVLPPARPRGLRPGPGRRRHPAAAVRRLRRPRGPGAVQRLGGPAELRVPVGRAGAALAARGRLRRGAHPRADLALAGPADLLGGVRSDRGHVPHLQPALARDDRRVRDPPGRAGEDQRAGSRSAEYARRTLVEHLGGDAVVIPNGVDVDFFAKADPNPQWQGDTIGFIGRIDEPRKGLPVLMGGAAADPGRPAADPAARRGPRRRGGGRRGSARGAALARGVPRHGQRRGQGACCAAWTCTSRPTPAASFGIILVEAMSAGAPVLASDLDAFVQVLDQGAAGEVFANENADALADAAVRLLDDPARRAGLRERGSAHVRRFDWSTVGADILSRLRDGHGRRGSGRRGRTASGPACTVRPGPGLTRTPSGPGRGGLGAGEHGAGPPGSRRPGPRLSARSPRLKIPASPRLRTPASPSPAARSAEPRNPAITVPGPARHKGPGGGAGAGRSGRSGRAPRRPRAADSLPP